MADERWAAMSLERLRAAKTLLDLRFYRDSISRSYYAAYCAGTGQVLGQSASFAQGRRNPSHDQLPDLILNAGHIPRAVRRRIKTRLYFLRYARESADYRPSVPIDRALALDCLLKAAAVIKMLED